MFGDLDVHVQDVFQRGVQVFAQGVIVMILIFFFIIKFMTKSESIQTWFKKKKCVPNEQLRLSLTNELQNKPTLLDDISRLTEDAFMTVLGNLEHKNKDKTHEQWSRFIDYLKTQGTALSTLCTRLNSLLHDFFTFMENNNEQTISNNITRFSNLYLGKILHYFNRDIIPSFEEKKSGYRIPIATANPGDFTSMEAFLKDLLKIRKDLNKIGTGSTQFKQTSTQLPVPVPVPNPPIGKKVSFVQKPIVHILKKASVTQSPTQSPTPTSKQDPSQTLSPTTTRKQDLSSTPLPNPSPNPSPTILQPSRKDPSPTPSPTPPPFPSSSVPLPLCPTPSSPMFGELLIAALVILFL